MNNNVLTVASQQWASRPDDERYTSLTDMLAHFERVMEHSRARVVSNKRLQIEPVDLKGLRVNTTDFEDYHFTNWSFGQLASLAKAPAGYLRTLPAPLAADLVNYGLRYQRDVEDVGVLFSTLQSEAGADDRMLRAATGPNYGRIWNRDVTQALVSRFGDGVTGDWKVPGEFGHDVLVTKANTTLYASDRDMFVFLADERNRVEIANRRDGKSGAIARGFYVWNSEVGASTFGVGTFLFDFVCSNRMIWGVDQFQEIRLRHTAGAPDRFLSQITPALQKYAEGAWAPIEIAIEEAKKDKLADVDEFLSARFGKGLLASLKTTHALEENRPIETRWDAAVAATALARSIQHQDERVALERNAGRLLG